MFARCEVQYNSKYIMLHTYSKYVNVLKNLATVTSEVCPKPNLHLIMTLKALATAICGNYFHYTITCSEFTQVEKMANMQKPFQVVRLGMKHC